MTRNLGLVLLLVLPPVGAACGYLAGPLFASVNDRVQLSDRIWAEVSLGLKDRTDESKAFRGSDRPFDELSDELYAEARQIERRFGVGAALFGAWCGLVIALKLMGFAASQPRTIYEVNQAECVACGRCFLSCPREHLRLKNLGHPKGHPTAPPKETSN